MLVEHVAGRAGAAVRVLKRLVEELLTVGGAVTLAQILSEVAGELTVEIKPSAWKPPLPGDG